jgi:hypothetical protein
MRSIIRGSEGAALASVVSPSVADDALLSRRHLMVGRCVLAMVCRHSITAGIHVYDGTNSRHALIIGKFSLDSSRNHVMRLARDNPNRLPEALTARHDFRPMKSSGLTVASCEKPQHAMIFLLRGCCADWQFFRVTSAIARPATS